MKYISTRGGIEPVEFSDAVMMGLSRDGGLLLPSNIPDVSKSLTKWRNLNYTDLAFEIMRIYADLPAATLRNLIRKSYSTFRHKEVTPVVPVNDMFILELFHGPTLAFKDVALQFLGSLFELILSRSKARMNILAATSGDTGSAAIYGVKGKEKINIFVMHPQGKISATQERQMTAVSDDNVFNMAIKGTFDDCQRIMKSIFNDLKFKDRFSLGSVNSINWARVLAQIVYYFYAAFRVMDKTGKSNVSFCVPTGNFGDIFAGYIAMKMGLPISRLVLATNENDILARFYDTGVYSLGEVHSTFSPSMDIQVASNFERYLFYREGESPKRLKNLMEDFAKTGQLKVKPLRKGVVDERIVAGKADNKATLSTIKKYSDKYNYLLDPHTAVGVYVGTKHLNKDEPMICLATAHPAKFGDVIIKAIGRDIARHPVIDGLKDLPTRCKTLSASAEEVRSYIEKNAGE